MVLPEIILASQSPRRKQLLEWAEIPFRIIVQPTPETYPADLLIDEVPVYIAQQKALAVKTLIKNQSPELTNNIVLAADTIVVLKNEVMNKPANKLAAIEMLTKLSGKEHRVITGVVIMKNEIENSFAVTTYVRFHTLTPAEIEFYVDKYQPYDKAGGYAIQEWIGVIGIASINGDFYNVMGLPVSTVVKALYTINS